MCVTRQLWVRSLLEEMMMSVAAKSGVEFRHSTRIASKIRRKVGNGVPSAYPALCGIQSEAFFFYLCLFSFIPF